MRGIESRAADLINTSSEFGEPLQLVSYTDGQEFQLHHDAGTLLDDASVGPERGACVMWTNEMPDGQPGPRTVHKANPIRGELHNVGIYMKCDAGSTPLDLMRSE